MGSLLSHVSRYGITLSIEGTVARSEEEEDIGISVETRIEGGPVVQAYSFPSISVLFIL